MASWTDFFKSKPPRSVGRDLAKRLDRIDAQLTLLIFKMETIMATSQELLDLANATVAAVNATKDAVAPLPAAVDKLEAAVTEALKNLKVPAADQANIDAAFAALSGAVDTAVATTATAAQAAADAADGVDEAAQP